MFSIDDILDLAIQIEENGEQLLRTAQRRSRDPELRALFKLLADEEEQHITSFSQMKPAPSIDVDTAELEAMGRNLLGDVLGEETFSLQDVELAEIEDAVELIRRMIEFEKDTVLFYEMIRSVVSDAAVARILEEIISQEKQHAHALRQYLDSTAIPGRSE